MSQNTKPRKTSKATKCSCGCGQATAESCRQRKAECPECSYIIRLSREMITRGLPICPCGERMELPCLFDRALLGEREADDAWSEHEGRRVEHELRSEYAKRAIQSRRRCKNAHCGALVASGALHCPKHAGEGLPF